jgi:hypothetical protein
VLSDFAGSSFGGGEKIIQTLIDAPSDLATNSSDGTAYVTQNSIDASFD